MSEKWPLGVFASIDAGLGVDLQVAHELGVRTIHLHTPQPQSRTPERIAEFRQRLESLGIRVTCVFAGFEGESYADIPTTTRTVGLVPRDQRATRVAELREIIQFAHQLGVDAVGLHLGFVPHDPEETDYQELLSITRDMCDACAANDQRLHLETGQEPPGVLESFLVDVGRPNLFINFDPANMILYGISEPLPALEQLGKWVGSVHCKDARWSDRPGETWGTETPLGEGDVDFGGFLDVLGRIGYEGPLTIEREIPQEPERQRAEIGGALELLRRLKKERGY